MCLFLFLLLVNKEWVLLTRNTFAFNMRVRKEALNEPLQNPTGNW